MTRAEAAILSMTFAFALIGAVAGILKRNSIEWSNRVMRIESENDLPISQKYALLYLRRSGAESLYNKLTDAMRAMGIAFTPTDFDHLRALALVHRGPQGRHALTPNGLWKAQTLARELANQYGIHHVTHRDAGRGSNHGPSVTCTCGWSTYASRTNANSLHRHAREHLAAVELGTWKKPRSVEEIFAAVNGVGA